MKFILSLFVFTVSLSAQAMMTMSAPLEANYCADRFVGRGNAQGYGTPENCYRAQESAESSALFACYAAGHLRCDLLASKMIGSNPSRCDYEALARASQVSMCSPKDTFIGGAWAQNFGSEYANCDRAFRTAEENATYSCYNSGANDCRTLYRHVLRTQGQRYCEVQVVVRARF